MIKLNKEEKGYLERIADALEEYVGNNSGGGGGGSTERTVVLSNRTFTSVSSDGENWAEILVSSTPTWWTTDHVYVTYDGQDYILPYTVVGPNFGLYGENGADGPSFENYPLAILLSDPVLEIRTAEAGDHTIEISIEAVGESLFSLCTLSVTYQSDRRNDEIKISGPIYITDPAPMIISEDSLTEPGEVTLIIPNGSNSKTSVIINDVGVGNIYPDDENITEGNNYNEYYVTGDCSITVVAGK